MDIKYLLKEKSVLRNPHSHGGSEYIMSVVAYDQSSDEKQFFISANNEAAKSVNLTGDIEYVEDDYGQDNRKFLSNRVENLIYKEIDKFAKSISFKKDMSAKDAAIFIDKDVISSDKEHNAFDKKVEKLFATQNKEFELMDQHYLANHILFELQRISKPEIQNVLYKKPYTRYTALMVGAKAVRGKALSKTQRQDIINTFDALSDENKDIIQSFLKQYDYDVKGNWEKWHEIAHNMIRKYQSYTPHPSKEFAQTEALARAADDLLRDELQYKYFKTTGNADIFFQDGDKKLTEKLSNDEILKKHARFGMQYHKDAYILGERMKEFGDDATGLGEFVTKIKDATYRSMPNQDVIKIYFDILKKNFNKFNIQESAALRGFAGFLAESSKDNKLKRQIQDTFGIKETGMILYDNNHIETVKEYTKKQLKNKLRKAAERIQQGNHISGVVVTNKMADLITEYDVKKTQNTYKKIAQKKPLSETQKKDFEKVWDQQGDVKQKNTGKCRCFLYYFEPITEPKIFPNFNCL